ncbi:MAG: right-handed parallel beta-helix repeat-containing protein [Thermoanaerobaculales bacterium]|nr:right-handed parallel beta-helix repeat-containing protein [Thermoanaerobaculales bacterium]
MLRSTIGLVVAVLLMGSVLPASATNYEVGPGQTLTSIGEVPWESLMPGDRVLIHRRAEPYAEKWVICRQGTEADPIVISGMPGPSGELPVIDGRNATTRTTLDFWNEGRGVVKIGGANTPEDTLPAHIVIENLEIRSGRPSYSFTDAEGNTAVYQSNAAAIYVEKARDLVIRNCILHDSGNGLFVGAYDGQTENILIESNWIYDNGIEGSIYQHNTYTAAIHITYQYNRFGPLRGTAGGNNLKDRSAGLVVRWNWIERGNRQLDLVDAEDSAVLVNHPDYNETHVYGNVLIEAEGTDNSQILHYGGDSGTIADYRKGTLYFYNNTVISTRAGNTTLMRLSTNDESADVRNNIIYTTASGSHLAMLASSGTMDLGHNWLTTGWVTSHDSFVGALNDDGANLEGSDPEFDQDYALQSGSPCVDAGTTLNPTVLPDHALDRQYVPHQGTTARPNDGVLDLGAFEFGLIFVDGFESAHTSAWSSVVP